MISAFERSDNGVDFSDMFHDDIRSDARLNVRLWVDEEAAQVRVEILREAQADSFKRASVQVRFDRALLPDADAIPGVGG